MLIKGRRVVRSPRRRQLDTGTNIVSNWSVQDCADTNDFLVRRSDTDPEPVDEEKPLMVVVRQSRRASPLFSRDLVVSYRSRLVVLENKEV